MYHKTTIFDLNLPRALAGEMIGRKDLAELGSRRIMKKKTVMTKKPALILAHIFSIYF